GVGLDVGDGVAQGNPAAIGAPDVAAHLAVEQVHLGHAVGLEIDPADVRAPGITAQVAEAVLVHAEVGGGIVLILNLIGGRAAAEINPADVGGIDVAGADILPNDGAVVGVAAAIHPAEVRAPSVTVGGVNCRA